MKLQTIASVCECSRSSVKRALTVLRDRGFIDIKGGAQKLHGKGHRQTCNRYYLLDTRQSQGQIGVISTPICAFYHGSLGGSSIVSVQPCPLFSYSGAKLGQDMRKPETYRNEIKSYIIRTGMTMTEVVDYLSDEYGWSRSVPNLSGKLKRGSLRYGEAVELADALGYDIVWEKR